MGCYEKRLQEFLDSCTIPDKTSVVYSADGSRPVVSVNCGTRSLVAGRDYKISFPKNKKGSAAYSIKFAGNYKGQAAIKDQTYTVTEGVFAEGVVSVNAADMVVNKKNKVEPKVYVDEGGTLINSKDYTVEVLVDGKVLEKNQVIMSESKTLKAKIRVTGRNNYNSGVIEKEVTIYPKDTKTVDISKAKIKVYAKSSDDKAAKSIAFSGDKIKPGKTEVLLKGEAVKANIKCYNNLTAGKAVVVAFGKATSYAGAAKGSFKIK